jgi:hypothetical protein
MTRSHRVLIAGLAVVVALTSEARAGNRLFVGGLSWNTDDDLAFVDTSTDPARVVQDVSILLTDARVGTLLSPGSTLPASSSLGIVNLGPDDLGDAGFFDVFYTGLSADFPTSSFFDVFFDITDPGTGEPAAASTGTVKFFNDSKGFGFISTSGITGSAEYLYSLTGEINPVQPGLSFSELLIISGNPGELNFDGIDVLPELQFDGTGLIDSTLPLFRITITGVPEPSAALLAVLGTLAMIASTRRRRR